MHGGGCRLVVAEMELLFSFLSGFVPKAFTELTRTHATPRGEGKRID